MPPGELLEIYKPIHTACLKGDYEFVDKYLQYVDIENARTIILMGLARLTFMWKDKIPYWKTYVKLGYEETKKRNNGADSIYRGLTDYIE